MIVYSHANETHFHEKGFALNLFLKVRVKPISFTFFTFTFKRR